MTRFPATNVIHGQEVCYRIQYSNGAAGVNCEIRNFDANLFLPDGTSIPMLSDATIFSGEVVTCPSGDPRCVTPSNCTIAGQTGYRYFVAHADEVLSFTGCPPITVPGIGKIVAHTDGLGDSLTEPPDIASACATANNNVPHACCEPCTGTCTEVLTVANCPFPSVFTPDKSCAEVNCTPRNCDDQTVCTTDRCIPETGQCENNALPPCDDSDPCTDDRCDPVDGCVFVDNGTCRGQIGCRITGGRTVLDGQIVAEPNGVEIIRGQGGGQVGAPCGCIGCFDEFDHIQGQWQYSRKRQQGTFHARDFNSLICGCDATSPACDSSGVAGSGFANPANFTGDLCNPDNPIPGPEPRRSPANVACFSGIGSWTASNGRKTTQVAFRVEVEDRGEPAAGRNSDDTCDVYQIRIWIPGQGETVEGLAAAVCCIDGHDTIRSDVRAPNIQDGGNLVHGNLQIHPMLNHSKDGVCPVPDGTCQQP